MVAPLVIAGVIASGTASSIVTGVGLDKLTGRKTTERDIIGYAAMGAVPGMGYAGAAFKTARRIRQNRKIFKTYDAGKMYGKNLSPSFFSGTYIVKFRSKAHATGELVTDAALYGAALMGSVYGYDIGVNYALDKIYAQKPTRALGGRLTSTPEGAGTQPKRSNASAGKRVFSPRLSKGENRNVRARRKTSYCKLHKKYDFCKYYKR
jgi:hypothetical protein